MVVFYYPWSSGRSQFTVAMYILKNQCTLDQFIIANHHSLQLVVRSMYFVAKPGRSEISATNDHNRAAVQEPLEGCKYE